MIAWTTSLYTGFSHRLVYPLSTIYPQLIRQFIAQESLPETYAIDAEKFFLPLVAAIKNRLEDSNGPLIVGINGAQGTGKSTLAELIQRLLDESGYRVVHLSIDDFYLSRARRIELAQQVHPLLATRGVPGTHDTSLALATLESLLAATAKDQVVLPAFDKSLDDCVNLDHCPRIRGPLDLILLEGWFVGATPQADAELEVPVNDLERDDDVDGRWRRYVNTQLGLDYQRLFAMIHYLIVLQAPGFEMVFDWRSTQELKLREHKLSAGSNGNAAGLMDEKELQRFIQHFERLTRHCLQTLPPKADAVLQLNDAQRVAEHLD